MKENTPGDPLREQIVQNMEAKTTDELLQIWQRNDTQAWTSQAFQVIHDILQDRLGVVPPQGVALAVDPPAEVQAKAGPDENDTGDEDTYTTPSAVLDLAYWLSIASKVVVGLTLALMLIRLITGVQALQASPATSLLDGNILATLYAIISIGIAGAVNFFILQGASHVLYLLLDIQANTFRGAPKRS